jgi:(S)-ureidoglycine aminohydrolase
MHPLGQTRTAVHLNHAFIAPDGHVQAALPDWTLAQGIILISPRLSRAPQFTQYMALMQSGATSGRPMPGVQRFVYVMEGTLGVTIETDDMTLDAGHFAYIPADTDHQLTALTDAKALLFEKVYVSSPFTMDLPIPVTGNAWAGEGTPFMGDEAARLRVLLPTDLAFDMAINLFSFQSGAALPYAETHIMEHGLYLLEGQGVYRLDDCWYPIQAGDSIWMGPYCPQWFCAFGKTQSTYIYYKDVNRDPLA